MIEYTELLSVISKHVCCKKNTTAAFHRAEPGAKNPLLFNKFFACRWVKLTSPIWGTKPIEPESGS